MKLKNASFALAILFCVSMAHAQVTGSGTKNDIPVWTGTTTLGNSVISQLAGNVGIGTKKPDAKLDVVTGSTTQPAITGSSAATNSVPAINGVATATTGVGVNGSATATSGQTVGVYGGDSSKDGVGVFGNNTATSGGNGVLGTANSAGGIGVFGTNAVSEGYAVGGLNTSSGFGVSLAGSSLIVGYNGSKGLFNVDNSGDGYFAGNLSVTGNLTKGSGSFKIDHPLDPANKYLEHSFVESPDMMNIYNGVIVLDSKGKASVSLPEYFQALNTDFRYQLTAIGAPGPNLYVAEEISGNRFSIAGGKAGAKVSWQVTGVRQDAYAKAHRIKVEEDKPAQERGRYLHPELFGATEKEAIGSNITAPKTLPVATPNMNAGNLR